MVNDARGAGAFAAVVGLLTVVSARAESVEGRVRIGFEGGLLEHRSLTASGSGTADVSTSDTSFALGTTSFGPVIGYGVSDAFVLGARLSLLSQHRSWDAGAAPDSKSSGVALHATGEFLFGDAAFRPFVGPTLGYESTSSESEGVENRSSGLLAGVQGGVHAFATPSFSVDPSVMLAYTSGSIESANQSVDTHGFVLGIRIGLSGWLGDAPALSTQAADGDAPKAEAADEKPPVKRPKPFSSQSDGRVVIGLSDSSRLIFEALASRAPTFRYIAPVEAAGDSCDHVLIRQEAAEVPLSIEKVSVVEQGSTAVLVIEGRIDTLALTIAGAKSGNVQLVVCDREVELDELARLRIRRFAVMADR